MLRSLSLLLASEIDSLTMNADSLARLGTSYVKIGTCFTMTRKPLASLAGLRQYTFLLHRVDAQTSGFGFTISWATNQSVVVEASTTLAQGDWSPISTNLLIE